MGKRGPCRFTARELARVLRAGESAGIPVQVNIARDGSLTVSPAPVNDKTPAADKAPSWDEALGHGERS
jgi:hypothetical protein